MPRAPAKSMLVAAALLLASAPSQASDKGWRTASDVAVYSLMAVALGVPLVQGDEQGALQAGGSIAAATVAAQGLKEAFPRLRPDGSDRKSFPSGHASNAFAAAASLCNRDARAKVCLPAFAVAGFVGLGRVEGRKHFWSDVAAGAALGTAAGFLITRDRPEQQTAALLPWADGHGGGMSLAIRF